MPSAPQILLRRATILLGGSRLFTVGVSRCLPDAQSFFCPQNTGESCDLDRIDSVFRTPYRERHTHRKEKRLAEIVRPAAPRGKDTAGLFPGLSQTHEEEPVSVHHLESLIFKSRAARAAKKARRGVRDPDRVIGRDRS